VIAYSGKHTSTDFNRVESYLAVKYGITKANNYVNSAGTTIWTSGGGYDNNIAGIGRDDMGGAANSGLNQKQSQSQNSGLQPVIGNVNITDTNANNTNNFGTDLSALVWGSDTGNTSFATSFAFGGLNNRMARIWRVQETGTVGLVKVALPVSQLQLNSSTTSLTFVTSSDAIFDGTDTRTAMTLETLGGVQYYTATVDFTSGQYFTFAALITAPGGVLGASLWLKADSGTNTTTNNASVTSWTDAYGLASTSGTGATYQSLGDNFNPGILFGGSGTNSFQYSNTTSFDMGGTNSFNVFALTKTSTNGRTYFQASNTGNAVQLWNNGAVNTLSAFASFAPLTGTKTVTDGKIHILGTNRTGTAFTNNFDGGADGSGTNSISFPSSTTAYVGNTSNNAQPFNGNINELIVYGNTSLTAVQQQRVNTYLAIKYGVTLDQTTPQNYLASDGTTIWWNAAANSGYNNNIAGIARDNASALHQKQSQSVNSGIQPVIGNVNITDTNANNNNSLADLSALVWGSDTGSPSFATSFIFGGLNNRIGSIWKMQKTGTVGFVKIALPANQIAVNITQLNLLTSTDNIFDGTDTRTAMTLETLGGVQYYTATVDVTTLTRPFFTFAAFITAPGGVLSGLTRWHKADAGVTTATGVSAWVDQISGAAISQATAANQPAYNTSANLINFNPNITFDGSNDNLTNSITGLPQGAAASTFYFVDKPSASNTSRYAFAYGATSGTASFQSGPAGTFTTKQGGGSAFASQTNGYTLNIPSITRTGYDAAATRAYLSHNAATEVTSSTYTQNVSTNAFAIGSRSDGAANFFTGDIPEVIAYTGKNSASELIRVESYLAIKYGITKSGDYQNSAAGVIWTSGGGYDNNIAGIARDDASALNQRVSRSVNSGNILTIATNANFTLPNNDVSRTAISNDLSSLLIGDDNGATTRVTTNLASGFNTRIARLWRVQTTNYTQAVSLQFSGLDTSNFTWSLVWKAADANFTTGSTTLGTLDSSGQITLATAPASGYLSLQAVAIDSDGDGVFNADDLDDDNDGIQDTDEVTCANLFTNGTFNGGTTGWTINSPWEYRVSIPNTILQGTASTGQTVTQTVNFGTPTAGSNFIWSLDYNNANFGSFQENEFRINGVLYALATSAAGSTIDIITYNGATVNISSYAPGPASYTTGFQKLIFTIPSSGISGNMTVSVSSNTNNADGDDVLIQNMYIVNDFCDTDGDGIPNRLDLDSDNDGCVDAIEGAASVVTSQLVTAGGTVTVGTGSTAANQNLGNTVNANGIPQFASVPYNYSNSTGQGIGVSQNASISGCIAPGGVFSALIRWHKADAGVTTATGVSAWVDQSLATTISQATAANQPAYNTSTNLINFNPSISFDGSNDNLTNSVPGLPQGTAASTFYFVDKPSAANTSRYAFAYGATSGAASFQAGPAGTFTTKQGGGSAFASQTSAYTVNIPSITRTGYNGTRAYLSHNAATEITGSAYTQTVSTDNFAIGSRSDGAANFFTGDIPEVITYGAISSASELIRIESYLAVKYGITKTGNYQNSSSSVIWDATANAGYNNNIAGISRDNLSGLNQKQSQSQNSGLQPVIGNVNIAATNAANTNNFSADLSSLLWGSDTGSTSFATSFVFGGLNNRMTRIWKVQETGTVGNVKVAIPASQVSPSISPLNVVVSSDAIFDGSDARTAMTLETLGGVQYYTATVDFTSGQYFTFAGFVTAPGGVSNGLTLWMNPDAGIDNAANISTWTDQVNGVVIPRKNTSTTLSIKTMLNFNKVVDLPATAVNGFELPASDANITLYDPGAVNGMSVFGAGVQSTAWNNFSPLMSKTNGGTWDNGWIMSTTNISGSNWGLEYVWGNSTGTGVGNSAVTASGTLIRGDAFIASGWWDPAVTNKNNVDLNAVSSGSINVATTSSVGSPLGVGYAQGFGFGGQLGDQIYYNRSLSVTERARVQSYLSIKFGTTLGNTALPFNYLNSAANPIWTGSSTYQNNIAGIARDDASALNQKQSQSVNSGLQPVIGNVNITDTNANNTNNFSTDLSALVWGSDTGSTTFATSFTFGGLTRRMTRIWTVQETGTVGTVKVALPANQLSGSITQLNLVVSSDATFDGSDPRTAMTLETLGGVQYYTATVDFTSGQFFSFAGIPTAPGGVFTGLARWHKADAGVTTATGVSAWADQITGNTIAQGTAANQPVYNTTTNLVNFNPSISFDGTNDALTYSVAGLPQGAAASTFYFVDRPTAANASRFAFGYGATSGTASFQAGPAATFSTKQGGGSAFASQTGAYTVNIPSVTRTGYDGTRAYLSHNGLTEQTGTTYTQNVSTNNFAIGSRSDGAANFFTGDIPEVVAYTGKNSASELIRVESYLAIKYGITKTGDYQNSASTVIWANDASYQNNVAGILRDDVSALHQKISKSVNSGSVLTISTDTDFTSANSTHAAIGTDLQSLVIGETTGAYTFTGTAVTASGITFGTTEAM
uniref:beta strand repeat-containing protein n=1 Tax=Chryseobacterium hispalense TaxID=1453492 RepID=UPI000554B372